MKEKRNWTKKKKKKKCIKKNRYGYFHPTHLLYLCDDFLYLVGFMIPYLDFVFRLLLVSSLLCVEGGNKYGQYKISIICFIK